MQHCAFGKRRDRQERIGSERARHDGSVHDVEPDMDIAGASARREHLALVVDDPIAMIASDAAAPERVRRGGLMSA